jgi:hypothetical protein
MDAFSELIDFWDSVHMQAYLFVKVRDSVRVHMQAYLFVKVWDSVCMQAYLFVTPQAAQQNVLHNAAHSLGPSKIIQ